jgi:lipoprotein NlpD
MQGIGNRSWLVGMALVSALVIAGCSSPRRTVSVEDRGTAPVAAGPAPITTDSSGKPLPGIENYGKPGYYAVRPGDTIRRIAAEMGQSWQDIAQWNNLDNPNLIEVGQVLRVVPPAAAATTATAIPAAPSAPPPVVAPVTVPPSAAASGDGDLGWIWPAQGALIAGFDEARNKGLDISGQAGDAVLAAADGRVVYAGAGLRGFGNLIILKHNDAYLTAYAHNRTLLVKEEQSVKKGQKIAEMGASDADRVKLHFEIRRQGKPIDPMQYLPARQ